MMRRTLCLALAALLLILARQAVAEEEVYIPPERLVCARLLAPPPALDSSEQKQDMDTVAALQRQRTPAQEAQVRADAEYSVFRFADVLGPQAFTSEKLPATARLFKKVKRDVSAILAPAKATWNRPRPFVTNPDIHPCVDPPKGDSYPSQHSTFGTVTAIVLANMVPEKAAEIHGRGERFRQNRVIAGVHYPSDVAGGRIVGSMLAAFLFQDPQFLADFAQARDETRAALGLAAGN
jgi:acid phosphatase (class A)